MEPEAGRENFLALFETPEDTKDGAGDTALLRLLDALSLSILDTQPQPLLLPWASGLDLHWWYID